MSGPRTVAELRPTAVTRVEVEDLLYHEAFLLDEWRLDDWLALWSPNAEYVIPTNDNPAADPDRDLKPTRTTTTAYSQGSSSG